MWRSMFLTESNARDGFAAPQHSKDVPATVVNAWFERTGTYGEYVTDYRIRFDCAVITFLSRQS